MDLAFWIADYAIHIELDGYADPLVPIAFSAPLQDPDDLISRTVNVVLYSTKLSRYRPATFCLPTRLTVSARCSSGTMCFGPVTHAQMLSRQRTRL